MILIGVKEIDADILEIARETSFDVKTAKEFYLITGDKEYCKELSFLFAKGWELDQLEFVARSYALVKSKNAEKKEFEGGRE